MPDGAAAGAAAAAMARAIKATGAIVRVEQKDFESILGKTEKPLVIVAEAGLFSTRYQYMTSYKGFAFITKTVALCCFLRARRSSGRRKSGLRSK